MNLKPRNLNYLARAGAIALALALILSASCGRKKSALSSLRELFQDEAKLANKTPADFPQITADIFKPMDGGIELTPEEIMGRNAWNLWTGGNQYFWERIAREGYELIDLL